MTALLVVDQWPVLVDISHCLRFEIEAVSLRKSFETFTSLFMEFPPFGTQDPPCVWDRVGNDLYWRSLEKEGEKGILALTLFLKSTIIKDLVLTLL